MQQILSGISIKNQFYLNIYQNYKLELMLIIKNQKDQKFQKVRMLLVILYHLGILVGIKIGILHIIKIIIEDLEHIAVNFVKKKFCHIFTSGTKPKIFQLKLELKLVQKVY